MKLIRDIFSFLTELFILPFC